ncbi:lipoprotein [uncultured Thiocystis sp.]|jgi:predicted small lipoprotein YifL|uniref:LPS translocon maturation chaperone LptM n=1 Tax=uncultured Thiocystis sp. TaxID=1202134 RepID=UPI0025E4EDB1|nr:lipoprotein [uncultured Thiocystis sp.]
MHCWARSLFIAVVVALGILGMLGACGQKGALYLPEKTPAIAPAPGADVPVAPPLAPSEAQEATATSATRPNPP